MIFHAISGLPRSGSTLLAALLRQNPRFYAEMTSPVVGLLNGLVLRHEREERFCDLLRSVPAAGYVVCCGAGVLHGNAGRR